MVAVAFQIFDSGARKQDATVIKFRFASEILCCIHFPPPPQTSMLLFASCKWSLDLSLIKRSKLSPQL